MTSNRRALVRAVAVSAAVSGALLAPAAAAFADSPAPAPSQSASSTPSGSKKDESKKNDKEQDAQEFKLSNNAVAHVYTLPAGGYMAWITMNGQRIANLSADKPTATVKGYQYELNQANGFVGVLHPDGWHSEQDKPKPHTGDKKKDGRQRGDKSVMPKGGVKAGAEGVQEQNPALLVGGGGMAAAGAAGLGFAMLRRGRGRVKA
ncbi:hypothetical protein ABT071_36375 [Streptomyces sp. NPDC002506]|uniref:hypothetical protein n=1 Tax=Streptomyces sp. NPDC002506 TaxID=3154536 RepID=UPI0033344826